MTNKYASRYADILFYKMFLAFERFLVIRLSKYVFLSLCMGNFLLDDLKILKKHF
jgi:hypothetical protein